MPNNRPFHHVSFDYYQKFLGPIITPSAGCGIQQIQIRTRLNKQEACKTRNALEFHLLLPQVQPQTRLNVPTTLQDWKLIGVARAPTTLIVSFQQ